MSDSSLTVAGTADEFHILPFYGSAVRIAVTVRFYKCKGTKKNLFILKKYRFVKKNHAIYCIIKTKLIFLLYEIALWRKTK